MNATRLTPFCCAGCLLDGMMEGGEEQERRRRHGWCVLVVGYVTNSPSLSLIGNNLSRRLLPALKLSVGKRG